MMNERCYTCEYEKTPGNAEPCRHCKFNAGMPPQWTAKGTPPSKQEPPFDATAENLLDLRQHVKTLYERLEELKLRVRNVESPPQCTLCNHAKQHTEGLLGRHGTYHCLCELTDTEVNPDHKCGQFDRVTRVSAGGQEKGAKHERPEL